MSYTQHLIENKENLPAATIISFCFPGAVEEMAENWGVNFEDFMLDQPNAKIDGEEIVFRCDLPAMEKEGHVVVTESGKILDCTFDHVKTGGVTWNGDDQYFENYKEVYTKIVELDQLENFPKLFNGPINADTVESAVCEFLATIYQK